jgi:acetyl-CoA hydrolase
MTVRTLRDIDHLCGTLAALAPKTVYLPGNTNRIASVEEMLWDHPRQFHGMRVVQLLSLGEGWGRAVPHIRVVTPFIGAGVRALVHAGLVDVVPTHLSLFPGLTKVGAPLHAEVAFAHVSEPDNCGRVTLGLDAGISYTAVRSARKKIAVINPNLPFLHIAPSMEERHRRQYMESGCALSIDEFDYVIRIPAPLAAHAPGACGTESAAIGRVLSEFRNRAGALLITNGTTLQLGIGEIPDGVLSVLSGRTDLELGIHSEMISDGVLKLMEEGVITGKRKALFSGRAVIGFAIGSQHLYEKLADERFAVLPQEFVNDPHTIARNPNMVSLNSALAVSLFGDVCASHIGHLPYSGVGGARDFALGARMSRGGCSIIALPSTYTAKDGTRESRIVLALAAGSHITVNYDTSQYIATEYGVAELEGKTLRERVEAMISIAHPSFRNVLAEEARNIWKFSVRSIA